MKKPALYFLAGLIVTFVALKVASTRYRLYRGNPTMLTDTWAGHIYKRADGGEWVRQ